MSDEVLQMMCQDERLTQREVELAAKLLLARALRGKQKLTMRPSASECCFHTRPTLVQRSFSPSSRKSDHSTYQTESLSQTAANEPQYEESYLFSRDRSATNAFEKPQPSISGKNLYTPYEYQIIEAAFTRLYERLKDTDGVRRSPEGQLEVHVLNVRQFFLQSYVNSQTSLNAMMSPFKSSRWVDLRPFTIALESIRQINYDHSFFNKDELAATKNNLIRQKLLFFFKLVDYDEKNSLSKFEVKTVSGMALRSRKKVSPDNLDMVVSRAFDKANEARGGPSDSLTFEEFFFVLRT